MPKRTDIDKILIIGSGPIIIGQACEFDYSGTQACKALRGLGYHIVLVNSNPATIMTDPETADATYIEPLNVETIERIIAKERPDALLPNLGGQSGLNLSFDLNRKGILDKYGVKIIGVNVDAIERGEDRIEFKKTMDMLGIGMARSEAVTDVEAAVEAAGKLGYPLVVRPAYTMGGTGGGFVYNEEELRLVVSRGLDASLVGQCLIEESVLGWEELELEVVRDSNGKMITVCFIENVDAMGVHTGDSFCTAPMLTVPEELQQRLQKMAYAIVESIEVIGGTNVQFAHDPVSDRVVVIEINPRTSRSSALASKATGFPIAYVSALLACGLTLDEIPYWRDGSLDKYTPSGDYVVVKFPRWAFEKFKGVEDKLGTQMRAVGEVMSIGANYKEAFQKAVRSLENGRPGLGFAANFNKKSLDELKEMLKFATSERQYVLYEAIRKGASLDELVEITYIKRWFLEQMAELVALEEEILVHRGKVPPPELLSRAKRDGFADKYLSKLLCVPEEDIRAAAAAAGVAAGWLPVPVSAVEGAAYYYSSYNQPNAAPPTGGRKIMVLGGGPNRIGQGIEFDYCCVHAAMAIREGGFKSIMVNCNPETVSTDYDTSDKLYFEPLTVEDVLAIHNFEKPEGVVCQFGGQTPLNIARQLEAAGVKILGTSPETIDLVEDRQRFGELMDKLGIPQTESGFASSYDEAIKIANRIGYPVMVRPSYVLGGRAMEIVEDDASLEHYLAKAVEISPEKPIMIDKFLEDALEAEADAIADGVDAFVPAVMEHIELAGVHSGDSACVIPSVDIAAKHLRTIEEYTRRIAIELKVVGLLNIQYAIANDKVYILEANPRASRTVPLVSKVCGIPMAKIAMRIMLGEKLASFNLVRRAVPHYGVKESVFPFNMFPEVDPVLGPEMRSTGEVLGMSESRGYAFFKAQEATQTKLPTSGAALLSVSPRDRRGLEGIAATLAGVGFKLLATDGTAEYLRSHGIECETVLKLNQGRPNILDEIKNRRIQLIVNTPVGSLRKVDDSYIRKTAIKYRVPYVTTLAAAKAAANGIKAFVDNPDQPVKSLQEYHAAIK